MPLEKHQRRFTCSRNGTECRRPADLAMGDLSFDGGCVAQLVAAFGVGIAVVDLDDVPIDVLDSASMATDQGTPQEGCDPGSTSKKAQNSARDNACRKNAE